MRISDAELGDLGLPPPRKVADVTPIRPPAPVDLSGLEGVMGQMAQQSASSQNTALILLRMIKEAITDLPKPEAKAEPPREITGLRMVRNGEVLDRIEFIRAGDPT